MDKWFLCIYVNCKQMPQQVKYHTHIIIIGFFFYWHRSPNSFHFCPSGSSLNVGLVSPVLFVGFELHGFTANELCWEPVLHFNCNIPKHKSKKKINVSQNVCKSD